MTDAFQTAVQWLEHLLLGSIAVAIATLAVAATGIALLTGRIDRRRATVLVIGCFTVFGAASIEPGLIGLPGATEASSPQTPSSPPPAQRPQLTPGFDPYAGAAPLPVPINKQRLQDATAPH